MTLTGTWKSFASGGETSNSACMTVGSGWTIVIVAGILSEFLWIWTVNAPNWIVPAWPTSSRIEFGMPGVMAGGAGSSVWMMPGFVAGFSSVGSAVGAVGMREQPVSATARAATTGRT